ncbi:peroxiredoxin [Bartonella krasnovii]|uniref:thioredoxin-dependent peroxiredoxin n=1 Tax=Bartonella krasnovii TaxID=2267275 RepID=A0A5B9D183_9HYPH|nr:peroxiredoxin [Bartonella krasnovii]QEE12192.1 peroxiredoxin [Bartonella krasnovii]UNF29871.1 peroxiredoxin [Bartonella krasnovii]UNF36233.1 peroxiredoxin [Bartonella krasnovii]UNF37936.1 peroxiredoxin [Bartonella krasnovii]UNF39565.1 peroxiredoxin [Bartonella krasnovii]
MTKSMKGTLAPDFNLPRDGGEMVCLSDFRGKPVVLYFYPKDDTSGCTSEALDFTKLKTNFDKIGVAVIGISPDNVKKHDKFKVKHGLDVILASDEEKTTLESYGVWVEKSMYGRKYMGVERSTFLINANGKIIEEWRKVSVSGHAENVLAAATLLLSS